jgi:hypothetical protein
MNAFSAAFATGVSARAGRGILRHAARDGHDAAAAPFQHLRKDRLDAVMGGAHLPGHLGLEVVPVLMRKGADRRADVGVQDQGIDRAQPLPDEFDHGVHLCADPHVGLDR